MFHIPLVEPYFDPRKWFVPPRGHLCIEEIRPEQGKLRATVDSPRYTISANFVLCDVVDAPPFAAESGSVGAGLLQLAGANGKPLILALLLSIGKSRRVIRTAAWDGWCI